MIGWACRQAAIWGVAGLLLYATVDAWAPKAPQDVGNAAAAATPADMPVVLRPAHSAMTYRADKQGHVLLDAFVNGARVHFLVDTGASFVSLTPADAAAAGISHSSLAFTARLNTANGIARAAPVKLREVRVGQLTIDDVDGVVTENLGGSLLGMSFLRRVDSWEMHDGVLTLNW